MANEIINPSHKVSLYDFLNNHPDLKAGRVELLAAFGYFMEKVRKVTVDTEANFERYLEEFKTKGV